MLVRKYIRKLIPDMIICGAFHHKMSKILGTFTATILHHPRVPFLGNPALKTT
jgi:hypothetical protein